MFKIVSYNKCKAEINVKTYRKFVVCPYCENRMPFDGSEYDKLDPTSSNLQVYNMLWIVLLADAEKWHECHLNGYAQVVDIQYQDSVRDLGYSGFVTNVMHI